MKTAREIIAAQVCAELNDVAFADLPEVATYLERKTHIDRPLIDRNEALVSADAILAALAAEGLSIVETGLDEKALTAARAAHFHGSGDIVGEIVKAYLSALSTREGKTE